MAGRLLEALLRDVSPRWEKRVGRAAFIVFACHCTLLSTKVPNQTSSQGNPFAWPLKEDAEEIGEPEPGPQKPPQPQPPQPPQPQPPQPGPPQPGPPQPEPPQPGPGGPGAPLVVLQSALAHDPSAIPVFTGEPGWAAPGTNAVTAKLKALDFGAEGPDVPSPVCFTNMPGVAVQTVILAAKGAAADLATLFDGPEAARLRLPPGGVPAPEMTTAELSLAGQFAPGKWQVAAVDLGAPSPAGGLFFGGSAGRPEWRRNWRGEIAEVVCFNAPPDADVRAGVAHYLALRWGVKGVPPATAAQRKAALEAGLRSGFAWSTLVILK